MKKDKFPDFKKEFKEAGKLFRDLPRVAGAMYLDFIEENFDKEQFGDTGDEWRERKGDNRRGGRAARGNRALLVLTSDLKNSFDYKVAGRDVIIMTPVPYAERHNEGLKGMPQRQFMGPSEDFDEKLAEHVEDELDKIFS